MKTFGPIVSIVGWLRFAYVDRLSNFNLDTRQYESANFSLGTDLSAIYQSFNV
jgi:hypothetical protein